MAPAAARSGAAVGDHRTQVATSPAPPQPAYQPPRAPAAVTRPPAGIEPSDVGAVEAVEVQDVPVAPEERQAASPNFEPREIGTGKKVYVGDPINFSLRDADIKEVLRTFAKIAGINMVIQPGVSGPVIVSSTRCRGNRRWNHLKTNNLVRVRQHSCASRPRAVLNRRRGRRTTARRGRRWLHCGGAQRIRRAGDRIASCGAATASILSAPARWSSTPAPTR